MKVEFKNGTVYLGDCLEIMPTLEQKFDLVLTSPPYDNLRTYNNSLNWDFNIFQNVAKNIKELIVENGVCVWVVGDATIDGSETGTSFKQALYFKEDLGLNLHDTMIYQKSGMAFPESNRYFQIFEYMFIFSKMKPKTFNPLKDRKNVSAGRIVRGKERGKDEKMKIKSCTGNEIPEYNTRFNVWNIENCDRCTKHPAVFSIKLAVDHIKTWTNEKDIVLDPFAGSGTTALACIKTNRRFVVIEKEPAYFHIICKRIKEEEAQLKLF
jgi:DNA modification methylase